MYVARLHTYVLVKNSSKTTMAIWLDSKQDIIIMIIINIQLEFSRENILYNYMKIMCIRK